MRIRTSRCRVGRSVRGVPGDLAAGVASAALLMVLASAPARAVDVAWNNPAGGNWNVAANWLPAQVPGAGDNALITLAGTYEVILNANATVASLTVGAAAGTQSLQLNNNRILTLNGDSSVGVNGIVTLTNGTVNGAGALEVGGELVLQGGILSATGDTTVKAGGELRIAAASGVTLSGHRLESAGMAEWTAGTITMSNGAVIANLAGGIFELSASATMNRGAGTAPRFENAGTIRRTGTGKSTIDPFLDNEGPIEVLEGELELLGGGTSSASTTVALDALLTFGGATTYDWDGTSTIAGAGTLECTGGTTTVEGPHGLTGVTLISGGTLSLVGPVADLGRVTISSGTLNLHAHDVNIGKLDQQGGTLTGSGTVRVASDCILSGGTQTGGGTTTLLPGGTFALDSGVLNARRLENGGTGAWTAGSVTVSNGGRLANLAGATLAISGGTTLNLSGAGTTTRFENAGSITRSGPGTVTTIDVLFVHEGILAITEGTLRLAGGSDATTGATVAAAGTLNFGAGTHGWGALAPISGAGTVQFSQGPVDVLGTYDVSGNTRVTGGTADLVGTIASLGNVEVTSGTLDINAHDVTVAMLTQQGGTVTGTRQITVTDDLLLSGGTQSGGGTTRVPAGGALLIEGITLSDRRLENAGAARWTIGTITVSNGTVIRNEAGGMFDITANNTMNITGAGTQPRLENLGAMTRGGVGTTTIDSFFDVFGPLDIVEGTLVMAGGSEITSAVTVASGATLQFSGGTSEGTAASSLSGDGRILVSGGTTTLAGAYDINGTTRVTGGTVDFVGAPGSLGAVEIAGGTMDLNAHAVTVQSLAQSAGTLTGSGRFLVTDTLQLGPGGTQSGAGSTELETGGMGTISGITLNDRALLNRGETRWISANIAVTNGALVRNEAGATFDITAAGFVDVQPGGSAPRFENAGTLTRTGTGTTTIQAIFDISGPVNVQQGVLAMTGGGSSSAATMVVLGAEISFGTGTFTWIGGSSLGGAGNARFAGGTVDHAGAYDITGTTFVTGGTADLSGPVADLGVVDLDGGTLDFNADDVRIERLLHDGGTLTGSGIVTVTDELLLSGGTQSGTGATVVSAGGTLRIEGGTLTGRRLDNGGTGEWPTGTVNVSSGASFRNLAGATLEMTVNGPLNLTGSGTPPTAENAGILRRSGTGTTTIEVGFTNTGTIEVMEGLLSFTAAFQQTAGSTTLLGGALRSTATLQIVGGILAGSGDITANVANGGVLGPGTSAGRLRIVGTYTQQAGGSLAVELAGAPASNDYDAVVVTGAASLAGSLDVTYLGGFMTSAGQVYDILTAASVSGAFTSFTGIDGANGRLPIDVVGGAGFVDLVVLATLTVGGTEQVGPTLVRVPITLASGETCISLAETVLTFDPAELAFSGLSGVHAGCDVTTEALSASELKVTAECDPGTMGTVKLVDVEFTTLTVVPSVATLLVGCAQQRIRDCSLPPTELRAGCRASGLPDCVPGDIHPHGVGNRRVSAADFVIGREKLLGTREILPYDMTCGDVASGVETCDPVVGPIAWCISGDADFGIDDLIVIQRAILGKITFGCIACDLGSGGPGPDRRIAGDVAPLGARDAQVDVADAVVALRWAIGLGQPTEAERLLVDVMPAAAEGEAGDGDGISVVVGDGSVDIADVVKILRAAIGLDEIGWPARTLAIRLGSGATAPDEVASFLVATQDGWPAWAQPIDIASVACDGPMSGLHDTPQGWGVLCASEPGILAGSPALFTLRYRAPEPVDPSAVTLRWELLDGELESLSGGVVIEE